MVKHTTTYLPKDSFAFITHDSSRRVTEDENAIPNLVVELFKRLCNMFKNAMFCTIGWDSGN